MWIFLRHVAPPAQTNQSILLTAIACRHRYPSPSRATKTRLPSCRTRLFANAMQIQKQHFLPQIRRLWRTRPQVGSQQASTQLRLLRPAQGKQWCRAVVQPQEVGLVQELREVAAREVALRVQVARVVVLVGVRREGEVSSGKAGLFNILTSAECTPTLRSFGLESHNLHKHPVRSRYMCCQHGIIVCSVARRVLRYNGSCTSHTFGPAVTASMFEFISEQLQRACFIRNI